METATPMAAGPADSAATRAERVNQAYANEPSGLLGTSLGGLVMAWVQAPIAGLLPALLWCATLLLVTGARLWIRLRLRRLPVAPQESARWAHVFRAGVLLSGLVWGSAALLFFPDSSPAHQVFTAFIMAGVVAGAAAAYPPLEWAFPCFAVPVLASVFLRSLLSGIPLHGAMAVMIALYAVVVFSVARSVRTSSHSAIRLKFENRGLVEDLSRSKEKLEGEVARRTEELSRANAELRGALEHETRMEAERRRLEEQLQLARKMESLATLAGGVAHDFNNLLMGIGGQVSLLMSGRAQGDADMERLRSMERQVREGAELTRQLMGMAMGGKYEVRPLDPNALVRKVAALFARTHKEIRVTTRLEEGVGAIEADRGQVEQALLNICLNAWQAMPGGGTLDIGTRRIRVDEAKALSYGAAPGDFVSVSLADTGTGMDRSVLPRIFDPFFTTRETSGKGAGLGLSSAYGILRNHGGFIEVDSERGKGSVFTLYFPLSASAPAPEGPESSALADDSGRRTVLVVEDEPMVAEVAALMLQRLGFKVRKALSGEAALADFRERPGSVDLVLLDMIMPGMGGEETFRRLRELRPDTRVLLSSGYSREGRAQELIKAGCLGFLQKPYNLADLRSKLEEILGPIPAGPAGLGAPGQDRDAV